MLSSNKNNWIRVFWLMIAQKSRIRWKNIPFTTCAYMTHSSKREAAVAGKWIDCWQCKIWNFILEIYACTRSFSFSQKKKKNFRCCRHHSTWMWGACRWFNDDDLSTCSLCRMSCANMSCILNLRHPSRTRGRRRALSTRHEQQISMLAFFTHSMTSWNSFLHTPIASLIDELIIIMLSNAQIRRKIALTFFTIFLPSLECMSYTHHVSSERKSCFVSFKSIW